MKGFAALFGFLFLLPLTAFGQGAIQLPTFEYTAVITTVQVPDRGSAYLGGVGRARSGQVSRGLPLGVGPLAGGSGIGRSTHVGNLQSKATIIHHAELDQAILGQDPPKRAARSGVDKRAEYLLRHVGRPHTARGRAGSSASSASMSVDEIRRHNQMADRQQAKVAERLFRKGQQAAAAGKLVSAKSYFRMAARQSSGMLRKKSLTRLTALSRNGQSPVVEVRDR